MKSRLCALALAVLATLAAVPVLAQSSVSADYVVAVVNSEPITNTEVRTAVKRVTAQLRAQGQTVPKAEIQRTVVERLISDRTQLQMALEYGVRVDDAAIDQAELNLARLAQLDLPSFRQRMAKDGMSQSMMRAQLRDQLTLSRLRERVVEQRVQVSDQDVENAIATQEGSDPDPLSQELNLAQLLVAVPEKADAGQIAQLQSRAQGLLARVRAGEDFAALVKEYSDGDRSKRGEFGMRRATRYPGIFVQATQNVEAGGVADLVRTGAGFHILKVLERRVPTTRTVVQTHVRHILLRTEAGVSQTQATERLQALRARIASGAIDFATAAREVSQDGSANQGGDLGWAGPGTFVPEFEDAMNNLQDGQVSAPVVSRFGVHLIFVQERNRVELSPSELREVVRNELRETRMDEAFAIWARDVRERSYVELREFPDLP